ncbi:MAG: SpoIID/LytB domain-containing protein, partial [Candidatus Velamenicoccus archaeovorus]
MASSLLSRRSVAGITGLLLLVVPACTGRASPGPVRTSGGAPPASTAGPASPSGSPTSSPTPSTADAVRVRAPSTGSLLLRGSYPRTPSRCVRHEQPRLLARYPGTLAVARSDDGTLSLTVTLPFERYLEGIAEVPPSWPMAALEAQAIAARSYALASTGWSGAEGQTLERPICATTSCQVYAGIPVPPEPGVARWYRAVRQTAGEVLLYQGRPAQTVYFSTSNGRTYGNDQVWGSAPLPYLRSVPEHDDGASPTSHWRVRLPFPDLARFLRTAGEWPKDRAITGVRLEGSSVVVSGPGTSRSIDVGTFRSAVDT